MMGWEFFFNLVLNLNILRFPARNGALQWRSGLFLCGKGSFPAGRARFSEEAVFPGESGHGGVFLERSGVSRQKHPLFFIVDG
jgi:hypothetical protein